VTAILSLLDGKFVEMDTGEGKTLVFTMATALFACQDRKIVFTSANEYLSCRDADFSKPILEALNAKVSIVSIKDSKEDRVEAYKADVIYCDLPELALDFLRSSFAPTKELMYNIPMDILMVDEADSVLLDRAVSPYTISKPLDTDKESLINAISVANSFSVKTNVAQEFDKESDTSLDAIVYANSNEVYITEKGFEVYENLLLEKNVIKDRSELYKTANLFLITLIESAVLGVYTYKAGQHYIATNSGQIAPISQSNGRAMLGQFFNSGLQQVIEVKEGVELTKEHLPFASISAHNFVSKFKTVLGMSGTLIEDKEELINTFGADVVKIKRNLPLDRFDKGDIMFLSGKEKLRFTLQQVIDARRKQQPVLIGASNENEANEIAKQLDSLAVYNKQISSSAPQEEASIICNAGKLGAITVSTSMTGRGTDIILGGEFKEGDLTGAALEQARKKWEDERNQVIDAGGLLVIGYGRQRLKKQDRQLIGRAGRQGDPGVTITVSSLDDESLQPFHVQRLKKFLIDAGADESKPIANAGVVKSLNQAQKLSHTEDKKRRKATGEMLSEMDKQQEYVFLIRENWLTMSDEDLVGSVFEDFNTKININEAADVRSDILKAFDLAYMDYRVKVKELMVNMGLRGTAVTNMKVEISKELFKTFSVFVDLFLEDAEAAVSKFQEK
jgi:preprotein translocase subunit SecA